MFSIVSDNVIVLNPKSDDRRNQPPGTKRSSGRPPGLCWTSSWVNEGAELHRSPSPPRYYVGLFEEISAVVPDPKLWPQDSGRAQVQGSTLKLPQAE